MTVRADPLAKGSYRSRTSMFSAHKKGSIRNHNSFIRLTWSVRFNHRWKEITKPARTRYPPRFGTCTNNRIDIDGKERSILFQNASLAQYFETVFLIITQNHSTMVRTFFFIIAEERELALRILFREKERERKKYTRAYLKKTHQGNHEMSVERIASRVFRIKTIKRQHAVQILRRVPR